MEVCFKNCESVFNTDGSQHDTKFFDATVTLVHPIGNLWIAISDCHALFVSVMSIDLDLKLKICKYATLIELKLELHRFWKFGLGFDIPYKTRCGISSWLALTLHDVQYCGQRQIHWFKYWYWESSQAIEFGLDCRCGMSTNAVRCKLVQTIFHDIMKSRWLT